ncbi:MAG: hypothetical protein JST40_02895 [Armatimonadetes bacterium]|nr:hypothetical protein [Armatimonadota bacterium]
MISLALLAVSANTLYVGFGTASIVPPEPLPLGGYTARKDALMLDDGKGDDLKVRVLVIKRGDMKVAIASADLLTIPASLNDAVEEHLDPTLHLYLAATHTHCAPDSQMLNDKMTFKVPGIAKFDRKWLEWFSQRIGVAVEDAEKDCVHPVTSMAIERGTRDLNRGRRPKADPSKSRLLIQLTSGSSHYSIFSYAAHATNYDEKELHTRGDWPGVLSKKLEPGLVLAGAIGDVSPAGKGETPEARVSSMAEGLLKKDPKDRTRLITISDSFPFEWREAPIELAKPSPHPDFAKANGVNNALAQMAVSAFAPKMASVRMVRLGPVALIGIPGEPSSHLGKAWEAVATQMGCDFPVVNSHVGGWIGYLLDPEDYARGGYEATLNFYGKDGSIPVGNAVKTALSQLWVKPTEARRDSGGTRQRRQ